MPEFDVCAFTITAVGYVPNPRRLDILRRVMEHSSLRCTHRHFACTTCVDDYRFLSEKVDALLALFDGARCRSLLKMDTDSIFCMNRFVMSRDRIAGSYVGSMVRLHPSLLKLAPRATGALRSHNATWLVRRRQRFMQGAAYMLGRDVVALRRVVPLSGLEDVDVARSTPPTTRWVSVPARMSDCRDDGHSVIFHRCLWNETTVCGLASTVGVTGRDGR